MLTLTFLVRSERNAADCFGPSSVEQRLIFDFDFEDPNHGRRMVWKSGGGGGGENGGSNQCEGFAYILVKIWKGDCPSPAPPFPPLVLRALPLA